MIALTSQPVIIVGAGRSGTNMLRDVLTRLNGVDTWPCDEINYIWRYGNRDYPTDELTPDMATPRIKDYIRRQFNSMEHRISASRNSYLVEKTCANSLRVDFVDKIIPEAKYIFLVRDGRDVVSSARKRWKAPLDIPYLYAKARYVPFSDLGFYATRYFITRLNKWDNKEKALSVWGPKFEGMQALTKNHNLDYVCAAQWVRCMQMSELAFAHLAAEKTMTLRYEDFVENPLAQLKLITHFLEMKQDEPQLISACEAVQTSSIGKGSKELSDIDSDWIELMQPLLKKYNYSVS